MPDNKVRWGILSTARIGQKRLIPAIQKSKNAVVTSIASRDKGKAKGFAREMGIPHAMGSYEELLASKDVDAVYIPLPNSLHKEWTVKAAEAGKHVLCEKPMGLDPEEVKSMDAAARASNVKIMEAFMYRFHPQTEKIIQMVRDGEIGKLRAIQAAFAFRLSNWDDIRYNPKLGGGSLMDVGCYCVSICRTITGSEPVTVYAYANWAPTGVDELMIANLVFPEGVLAQFTCGFVLDRSQYYQVMGTDGTISLTMGAFLSGSRDIHLQGQKKGQPIDLKIPGADEYQLMVEHFSDCILNDKPVRYGAEDAVANMRVIKALLRSASRNGQPEIINATRSLEFD